MEREAVHVEHSPAHCPFCKGDLEDLARVVACAACGARHHDACRAEHGRCATCGSLDLLVPRAPKRRVAELPLGTRLVVKHEDDRFMIALPGSSFDPGQAPVLLAFALWAFFSFSLVTGSGAIGLPFSGGTLLVLLAVLGLLARRRYRGPAGDALILGPDAIEFPAIDTFFGFAVPVRATRAEVGVVTTENLKQGYALEVDVGLTRRRVRLGSSAFSEPEIDWIAAAIRTWKDEA